MNTTQVNGIRRPGILADLNFKLPQVGRQPKARTAPYDVLITLAFAGNKRKSNRYTVNFTNLLRRMNRNFINGTVAEGWLPKTVALANDRNKNMFVAFDQKDVPESMHISKQESSGQFVLTSMPAVIKCMTVWKMEPPKGGDLTLQIRCKAVPVNDSDTLFQLEPLEVLHFYGDGKPPKVIPFLTY